MCDRAITQLETMVAPGMRILEWGSGGSTVFCAKRGAEVTSIEHVPDWAQLVQTELKRRKLSAQVTVHRIDLEAEYVDVIDQLSGSFDLIVVDGRRRVECVLKAHSRVVPGGWLVLDDSDREAYLPAEEPLSDWRKLVLKGPRHRTRDETQTTMWQKPAELH